MTRRLAEHDDTPREDRFIRLRGARWADYKRLLAIRGDRSAPRLTYLEGEIEIMSPSRFHESIKSVIGRLVEVYCLENDVDFSAYGSWTLEGRKDERAAEPDECYVFGEVANPTRPDLAIEVVWTSGRIDKLEVYRMLGVREVWFWRQGRIDPYALRGSRYRPVERSKVLPGIDLDEVASLVDRPTASRAIREYRAALRGRKRSG